MAEFVYNNTKHATTSHILFKLNCGYHLCVFFKDKIDPHLRSRFANKLVIDLRK